MYDLATHQERPPIIVIEDVVGLLYGDSFTGLCEAIASLGMQFGALVMDAKRFIPQSRPRVFLMAVDERVDCSGFLSDAPAHTWAPEALIDAHSRLPHEMKPFWRWWKLPAPKPANRSIADIIEDEPNLVEWHTSEQTHALLDMMSETNRGKITKALRLGKHQVGFLYKRMRKDVQRAEVRFNGPRLAATGPAIPGLAASGGSNEQRVESGRSPARTDGLPASRM